VEGAQGLVPTLSVGAQEIGDHLPRYTLGVGYGVACLPVKFPECLDPGIAQLDIALARLALPQVLDVLGVEGETGHIGGRGRIAEKADLKHSGAFLEVDDIALASDVVLGVYADLHHSQNPGLGILFDLEEIRDRLAAFDRLEVFLRELVSLQVLRKRGGRLHRGACAQESRPNQ
jgi:hypothetical protein